MNRKKTKNQLGHFLNRRTLQGYVQGLRWKNGFRCPHCGGDSKWEGLCGKTRVRFICRSCRHQVSPTAGTRLSGIRRLEDWCLAGWFIVACNRCVSPAEVQRGLCLRNKKTPRAIVSLYRQLMQDLAPPDLWEHVDREGIAAGPFFGTYVRDVGREQEGDLTEWIKAGWPRGFPGKAKGSFEPDPYIGELLFKYTHQKKEVGVKFEMLLSLALKPVGQQPNP